MKYYNVKNRSASTTTYRIPEDNIRRSFAPGEVKRISEVELEKLTFQPGGSALMQGFLQIIEREGQQKVGLRNVQPEYNMSENDIIELIKNGSVDAFLDALDFAPIGVIELIKKYSVSVPLTDLNKRVALKEKTGFDVDKAIANKRADEEEEKKPAAVPQRRSVESTPTVPQRRTTPNYKVVE